MKYTRLSLYYLAGYLLFGGIAFLFVPDAFSKILLSNTMYDDEPLRLAGVICILLGLVVAQMVRLRVEVLYSTSLMARAIAIAAFIWLYFYSSNPMFLSLLAIVGLGFFLTLFGYYSDRKNTVQVMKE